jgi:Ca2+-binding RTX toxin-like protein
MAKVFGTDSPDILDGWFDGVTDDADTIFGLGGNDWIFGYGGDDILQGGDGADVLNGGDGSDTASYGDSPTGVIVNLATGHGSGGTAEGDLFMSVENLSGSAFNDFLVGNYQANVLSGGWGNDTLNGGAGGDILNGGTGVDTASYVDSPAGVMVSLLWDTASGGDAQGDDLNSIENVNGSHHDDSLYGDHAANVLWGRGGDDTLLGFGGNDTLWGDERGGSGEDLLNGGAGADILIGGLGADVLVGGTDGDSFVWHDTIESAGVSKWGVDVLKTDVILDFNPAEDHIDLHGIDADATINGNQDFDFIDELTAAGGFSAAGQIAYFFNGTDTYVFLNTAADVDGAFEMAIRLPGQHALDASSFVL